MFSLLRDSLCVLLTNSGMCEQHKQDVLQNEDIESLCLLRLSGMSAFRAAQSAGAWHCGKGPVTTDRRANDD